jgi:hypothetical protein
MVAKIKTFFLIYPIFEKKNERNISQSDFTPLWGLVEGVFFLKHAVKHVFLFDFFCSG